MGVYITSAELALMEKRSWLKNSQASLHQARCKGGVHPAIMYNLEQDVLVTLVIVWHAQELVRRQRDNRNALVDKLVFA